jgi:putative copper resistance protein D
LDWPLAARAVNDASSLAWFGLALAPAYGGPRFLLAQRIAAGLALASLAVFAVVTMTNIVGPGGTLGAAELETMLGQTSFGHIWLLRGALCIAGLALASSVRASAVLSGLQLALLSFGGHAFARRGLLGASSETLHLLAAGAWVGGVLALALRRQDVLRSSARFSSPGYVMASVAPIAGLTMLVIVDGSLIPRVETDYGLLATAKMVLFVVLLAIAVANRFYSLPRANIRALRAGTLAELVAMAALSLIAATLAATSPAM